MVKIVSVEANIGAGKTTFINKFLEKTKDSKKFMLIPEPVDRWMEIKGADGKHSLDMFYSNQHENALPFQFIALITRRDTILEMVEKAKKIEEEIGEEVILITERTVISDRHIFALMQNQKGNINELGMIAYDLWNDRFCKESSVDKILYIITPADCCLERIRKRGRTGEDSINIEYLREVQKAHDDFYNNVISKRDHMIIDTSQHHYDTEEYDQLIDSVISYFSI